MINSRDPLRHAHVIGVFRFKLELEEGAGSFAYKPVSFAADTAIGRNARQGRVAVGNQAQGDIIIREGGVGSAKNGADQVVVYVRRAQRELGLFESQDAVVMPGALLERGKGCRMALDESGVGFLYAMNVAEELGT